MLKRLFNVSFILLVASVVPGATSQSDEEKETLREKMIRAEARLRENPVFHSSLEWLKKPTPCRDSVAASEEEMKPYFETIADSGVSFKMVPIPGGRFLMGSPPNEPGRKEDEGPQHEVEIKPFWMEEHEVTWQEFELFAFGFLKNTVPKKERSDREKVIDAFAQPTPPWNLGAISYDKGRKKDYPASSMTHYSAQLYCKWLTMLTGRYYRLPTEAEWEYACRAGTTTSYSFGNDAEQLGDYAWYFDNTQDEGYAKVKRKKPNAWGLYDMHGNVAEWVLDFYRPDAYQQRIQGQLTGGFSASKDNRAVFNLVVRGGHCDDADPYNLRSASRAFSRTDWQMQEPAFPIGISWLTDAPFVGFRVVRPLEPPKTEEEAKLFELNPEIWREFQIVDTRDAIHHDGDDQ